MLENSWKLIKFKNQYIIRDLNLLCNLKPSFIFWTLICSYDFDESFFYEVCSRVSSRKVGIQRCRVELRDCVDFGYVAVDAVANNCINEPVVSSYRNGAF